MKATAGSFDEKVEEVLHTHRRLLPHTLSPHTPNKGGKGQNAAKAAAQPASRRRDESGGRHRGHLRHGLRRSRGVDGYLHRGVAAVGGVGRLHPIPNILHSSSLHAFKARNSRPVAFIYLLSETLYSQYVQRTSCIQTNGALSFQSVPRAYLPPPSARMCTRIPRAVKSACEVERMMKE